jgi:hypothetical protein
LENPQKYKEILEHLLNLPTLTKFRWLSPITANLKILNPSVKTLHIDCGNLVDSNADVYSRDVKQLLRFPCIQWETEQETRSVSHCIQGKRKSCLTSLVYSGLFEFFPEIETLLIPFYTLEMDDISDLMNPLIHLRELKFKDLDDSMLESINCPQI